VRELFWFTEVFAGHEEEPLPTKDAGNVVLSMISRVNKLHRVAIHVLMNQIGNLCNRYNHCITGTNPQQNWVQCFVAKQCGVSYPTSVNQFFDLEKFISSTDMVYCFIFKV
jgi:hypothetical protein